MSQLCPPTPWSFHLPGWGVLLEIHCSAELCVKGSCISHKCDGNGSKALHISHRSRSSTLWYSDACWTDSPHCSHRWLTPYWDSGIGGGGGGGGGRL